MVLQGKDNFSLIDLNEEQPTWYAGDMAYGLNRLLEIAERNDTFLWQVYSDEEVKEEQDKKDVQLFHFPGKKEGPFVILLAGGAYGAVCSMVEAFPIAAKLNEMGITAFCLNYRTAQLGLLPKPIDDLAAALHFIGKHKKAFHVNPKEYVVGGFSAGGHTAAMWGTKEMGYRKYELPAPDMLLLGYPLITTESLSETVPEQVRNLLLKGMFGESYTEEKIRSYHVDHQVDADYPAVYIVHSKDDDTVIHQDTLKFVGELEKFGVTNHFERADTAGHGFGLGSATEIVGWIERAMGFLKESKESSYLSPVWMDISHLEKTKDIEEKCKIEYVENRLKKMFPKEDLKVTLVEVNESGNFDNPLGQFLPPPFAEAFKIKNMPPYCDIRVERKTGKHTEEIIIWSPLAWNDRFMGTAGGGNRTGGLASITQLDNTNRGISVPVAVSNGFTAATTNGGINVPGDQEWGLDSKTHELDWELIRNWTNRSTHWMTVIGKAAAEILHGRVPKYSYMNGGSGGGRQSMVEVQQYPKDYDGIWASCPAINWSKFLPVALWPIAVMNEYNNIISPEKMESFRLAVHEKYGGSEAYYRITKRVDIDPYDLVGKETEDGKITETDAKVMKLIWDGPTKSEGERLWYFFRPGGTFWNKEGLPVNAMYYVKDEADKFQPKIFPLAISYAKWVMRDPELDISNISIDEFIRLFEKSAKDFSETDTNEVNLKEFQEEGGKILIDHGTDDPLIPVDGTIDYYERLIEFIGNKEETKTFCRLFINPGDGHGNCYSNGPGMTVTEGMIALMNWVEKGIAPEKAEGILVDNKTKKLIRENVLTVV